MKKRNRLNRFLAIALTAAMTLQQSSIVGFASDIDETPIPVVTEAPAPVQEAETPAPEAAAPAAEAVQETPAATTETPAQDTSALAEAVTEPAADQANTAAAADEAAPAADTADTADQTPAEGASEENVSPEAQENAEGSAEAGTADASDEAASADEGTDGTAAASSDEAAEADTADPAAEVIEEPVEGAAVEGDTAAEENADDTEEDEEGEESEEDKEDSEEEEPEPTPTPEPTRRVYTGGNGAVTVTATLQYASAVPDDAKFIVNQIGATDDTLVYDIYFLAPIHDEEGNVVGQTEYEPEEGSVTLTFRFNHNQLSEDLGADKASDVTVVHVHDSGYEEVLNASVNLNGSTDRVTVQTDSFSTYYFKVYNEETGQWQIVNSGEAGVGTRPQTNTWNNDGTTGEIFTYKDIQEAFGNVGDYSVYANKLIGKEHIEGNIAVGEYETYGGSGNLNEATRINAGTKLKDLTIRKVVEGGDGGTFNFKLVGNGLNYSFSITVPAGAAQAEINLLDPNSVSQDLVDQINEALNKGAISLHELDSDGNYVANGNKFKGPGDIAYEVNYSTTDGLLQESNNQISSTVLHNLIGKMTTADGQSLMQQYFGPNGTMTYFDESEIQSINWSDNGAGNHLVITLNNGKRIVVENARNIVPFNDEGVQDPRTYVTTKENVTNTVKNKLEDLKTFSKNLANAKNGPATGNAPDNPGALNIINVKGETGHLRQDLAAAGFDAEQEQNKWIAGLLEDTGKQASASEENDQYLVINIDCTGFDTYYLSKLQIDGYDPDSNSQFSKLSSHVIFNLVERDGNNNFIPFDGTVNNDGVTGGTVLAPAARVVHTGGGMFGEVIANTVDHLHSSGEIHKKTIISTSRSVTASASNTTAYVEGEIPLTKIFEKPNYTLQGGEFSFEITPVGNAPMPAETVVKNGAAGDNNIKFGPIRFTKAGNYTYVIKEIPGSDDSIDYDTHQIRVMVNVGIVEGELVVNTVTPIGGPGVFRNKYKAIGNVTFYGKKVLENRRFTEDDKLTVTISGNGKLPVPSEINVPLSTNTNIAEFNFNQITYEVSDLKGATSKTFTYTVREEVTMAGTTKDAKTHTITVKVTDSGAGKLDVVSTYSDGEEVTFTNTYTSKGTAVVGGTKILNNRKLSADEFEFTIEADPSTPKAPLPAATKVKNKADGSFAFPEISYTVADLDTDSDGLPKDTEFKYIIRETAGSISGITYSKEVRKVTVKLHDNNEGTIETTITPAAEKNTFTNKYTTQGQIVLEGVKTLEGRDLHKNEFLFRVFTEDGKTVICETTNDADGNIIFPAIKYTQADLKWNAAAQKYDPATKEYIIKEIKGSDPNITYDDTPYPVTVTLKDDGKGTIEATANKSKSDITFVNTYDAKGKIVFGGLKVFENHEIKEGEFTFRLAGPVLPAGSKDFVEVTNKADGSFSFPTIEFHIDDLEGKTTKELSYKIVEVKPEEAESYIDYSVDEYVVKLTLRVKEGSVDTIEVTADKSPVAAVFTNKYSADGKITLGGTKILENRKLKAGEFTFQLLDEDGKPAADNVTNDENGSFSFPEITYDLTDLDKVGGLPVKTTKKYTVKEVKGTDPSITYSDVEYPLTVTLEDDKEGHIIVTCDPESKKAEFTNTYSAKGDVTLGGWKVLENRALNAGEFTFVLAADASTPKAEATLPATKEVKNAADGSFSFPKLSFTLDSMDKDADGIAKDTTLKYTITEKIPDEARKNNNKLNGTEYDTKIWNIAVLLHDKGDGQIEATVTSGKPEEVVFTNVYSATGELTLGAFKILENKELKKDEFTFILEEVKGTKTEKLQTAKNAADGLALFKKIIYTLNDLDRDEKDLPKETKKKYQIREEIPETTNGIIYDESVKTVNVVLTPLDNGTIRVVYDNAPRAVRFTNTYEAKGDITFKGTKKLDGRDLTEKDIFEFEIKEDGEGGIALTAKSDVTGKIDYPTIAYTLEDVGIHKYAVKETTSDGNGITVDSRVYEVTVEVSDNGDGTLEVKAGDNAEALDFVNTYEATGEITFEGTKTLEGRKLTDKDIFTFEIKEDGASSIPLIVQNDASGKINYPTITYSLSDIGTHKYIITEKATDIKGVTIDSRSYEVIVKVSDNGDGTLKVEADDKAKALDFINTYEAAGELPFAGMKSIDGRELTKDDVFTFTVTEEGKDPIEVKNDVTGKIDYPTISYTLDNVGKHTYKVEEAATTIKGVTIDTTTYTVEVTVSDNGDGTLKVEKTENSDDPLKLDFVNKYAAADELVLAGRKTLEGRELTDDDVFTFTVTEEGKAPIEVKSGKSGKIEYPVLSYTLDDVGLHTYTVKETTKDGKGITVDTREYTVKVNVTDNGDGTLKVEKTEDSADPEKLDFVNIYKADTEITFKGTKTLEGRKLTEEDVFEFEIKEEGSNSIPLTARSDVDGKINYPTIAYTLDDVGTHEYTVKETTKDGNGITVDTTVYNVTVEVTDKGDGKLEAKASDNFEKLNFINTYKADAEITFKGTKTLEGRKLTDKDVFEFEIKEEGEEGITLTAKSDATGKIDYPTIAYTLEDVGTHKYTVKETTKDGNGITVDTTVYNVTVEVTDKGDGILEVKASDNFEKLDFINTYKADAEITFKGTKTLEGRKLTDEDVFEFEIKEEGEGGITLTAKSDATGKIDYPTIAYTLDDVGTHKYTVKETTKDGNGITVDTTVYNVTVEVTDKGDGKLEAKASDNFEKLDFINTYKADAEITFKGTKTLEGRKLTDKDVFEFEIKEEGEDGITLTAKSDATGKIDYPTIAYTLDDVGTHKYTVKETTKDGNGITVDTTVYEVTVEVTDNGEGKLEAKASDNFEKLDFVNTYKAEAEFALNGFKVLEGREFKEGDKWTFTVTADPETAPIPEKTEVVIEPTSGSKADIDFGRILYTQEDDGKTYTYTVTESGKVDGVENDEKVHTVKVTITDNGDGTLKVDPVYSDGEQLIFTNTYKEYELILRKTFAGDLTDEDKRGGITFTVTHVETGESNTYTIADDFTKSGDDTYTLTLKVEEGTYVVEETIKDVEGYDVTVTYQVGEEVTHDKATVVMENGDSKTVEITDEYTQNKKATVEITKLLTLENTPDPLYAVDQAFYVQLFNDADCTDAASGIQPVVFKNASSSTAVFEVEAGKTYYFKEVSQNGEPIEVGMVDGTVFVAQFPSGNEIRKEETESGTVRMYFENEFVEIPDNFYKKSELTITKEVLTGTGQAKPTDEVFYAMIFDDAALTIPSTVVEDNFLVLDLSGGSTVSATTNVQVAVGGSYTLYIAEVDEDGKPVTGNAAFAYEATYDKNSVTVTEETLSTNVKITNKEKVTTPTPTPTSTVTPTPSKPGAPTGDSTNTAGYFVMLALAGILALCIGLRRRRRI